jgi:hypothetical protein
MLFARPSVRVVKSLECGRPKKLFSVVMSAQQSKANHAAWIGPLLILVGVLTYFTVAVKVPDLRDTAIVNLVLVAAGIVISIWALFRRRNWKSWLGFLSGSALAGLFLFYIFGFSNQLPAPDSAPSVGDLAPSLKLPDQTGRVLSLDNLRGERVLVVFYRGYW